jgi:hypothetical protein
LSAPPLRPLHRQISSHADLVKHARSSPVRLAHVSHLAAVVPSDFPACNPSSKVVWPGLRRVAPRITYRKQPRLTTACRCCNSCLCPGSAVGCRSHRRRPRAAPVPAVWVDDDLRGEDAAPRLLYTPCRRVHQSSRAGAGSGAGQAGCIPRHRHLPPRPGRRRQVRRHGGRPRANAPLEPAPCALSGRRARSHALRFPRPSSRACRRTPLPCAVSAVVSACRSCAPATTSIALHPVPIFHRARTPARPPSHKSMKDLQVACSFLRYFPAWKL